MCLLVVGGFIGLMNFGSKTAQGTDVSGIVYDGSGGPWILSGSPFIVVGNVEVPAGQTLTIEPGVQVKFDGFYHIQVDGTIIAIGTETTRINITSNKATPAPGDWKSIQIESGGHAVIKYCNISYGYNGINILSSNNEITANNVLSNERGIWLAESTNNTLINNNFINDGVFIWGNQLSHFNTHTIPDNNTVNGKPLYYLKNCGSLNIEGIPVGQLILANCTHVNIIKLQIENTDVGIEVAYSINTQMIDNDILNNDDGVRLHSSSNSNITGNSISPSDGYGILLYSSNNNTLTKNNVLSSMNGIRLDFSSNNNIKGNNVSDHIAGIYLGDSSLNDIIDNNISSNGAGIGLIRALYNKISCNNVSNNSYGIKHLPSSNSNIIMNNNVSLNNIYGIYIDSSSDNNITNNNISYNGNPATGGGGIYLMSSSNTNITRNSVSNNWDDGIYLDSSSNSRIYHNNFIDNTDQAFDDMNDNIWDDGYPSGGNYWSDFDEPSEGAYDDYLGPDQDVLGSDGKVDLGPPAGGKNPYVIDADSQDNYPLINPPVDNWPPTITNLQPPDTSTTNNTTPIISADYSDPSGINVSSVLLEVDGIDVTSFATVTASGVSYIPITALPDGVHIVYLEVKDNVSNLAMATWSFIVDSAPPVITNLQPPDASIMNNSTPMMGANYSDPSGINVSSVLLKVDDIDVTPSATITANNVTYTPGTALLDGIHTVYLEVRDNVNNLATVTWTFSVDTTPPTIILNSPLNNSVNPSGTILDFNITDLSPTQVNYSVNGGAELSFTDPYDLPTDDWPDGYYIVQINASDLVGNSNSSWYFFTIDSNPPTIVLNAPGNNSVIPNGTILSFTVFDLTLVHANYSINGGADIPFSGLFNISTAGWVDRDYIVQVNAVDFLGHSNSSWYFFTIDSSPPVITNLQPPDTSFTNDNTTLIGADYCDPTGINVSSVLLEVDGMVVTSSAMVTVINVTYTPGTALSEGVHPIYLEVMDNIGNLVTITWSFTVDTLPPITTIIPDNHTVKLGTLFTLTATDGDMGCGVNYTQYKIDDCQWIDYLAPFPIDTYGYCNITYRSVDYLGNIEDERTLSIYVPEVPVTTLIIGIPQYGSTPRYVNCFTQFSFSVIDHSGTGYDTYYYIDTSPPILYVEPFTVPTEGTHTIYHYSTDNLGNVEDTKEFDIIVDNTPPATDIDIGEPNYVSEDIWVTSATEFSLNAVDVGPMPVGVNHITYRIWNGTWSEWDIYQDGFTLGVNDSTRYVEFYSTDWLGNEEAVQNRSYIVDDTPPTAAISEGDLKCKDDPDDIWNVTSATTFALYPIDEGVGLNYTEYRIWNNGAWSEWDKYTNEFGLGSGNGTRYVEWYSVDFLGNKGGTCNETYFVDNIPPETNYLLLLESDNTEARLSLIPGDIGSGVNITRYRMGSGDWIVYSDTFVITESGEHVIYYFSVDILGNVEDTKEVTVLVEKPATPIPTDEKKKEVNNKPLIALIFSIILLIVGSYVSYKRPLRLTGESKKDRFLTWLIVVLPFVIAEIISGVVSLVTGLLSVPPLLGIGMLVDTIVFVSGLAADGYTYKKVGNIEEMPPEL